jgi:biotin transport system substrate-specific component
MQKMKTSNLSLRGMILASMFGAATAAGAYIMIPLPLVPITLQTLFLNLAAALLGGGLGALSQVVYVLIGIIGLPVFAGGKAGLGVLLGPTGGYLIGFIVGAYVVGNLIEIRKNPGFVWTACAMVVGMIVIYACGVTQLSIVEKLSVGKAVTVGALPFLIGDGLKILAAAFLSLKLKNIVRG